MPSLADIPAELLALEREDQFIDWLREIPLDLNVKYHLSHLWQTEVGTIWTQRQWGKVSQPPSGPGPRQGGTG